jgi:hypothetical protein
MNTLEYYELKQKYEDNLMERKKKIKKKKDLTIKEKRVNIKKILLKCVNCGKTGGTIFEEKNGMLKAVCASNTPCNLNINIKRKLYDNIPELEKKNDKLIEILKMRIIITKLDYLFGLNTSKDETVDKFNSLKSELANLSEGQLIINKNYGDILSGVNRDPLLNDANLNLANEIDELKKIYDEYVSNPNPGYLTSMVEKYITIILPLVENIRKMKYNNYKIEKEITASMNDEVIYMYSLVADTYLKEQMERERK